jgi:hypothetical protein
MRRYKLTWTEYGFWLRPVDGELDTGMTYEDGRELILDSYKKLTAIWKDMPEEAFMKQDIITKLMENASIIGG